MGLYSHENRQVYEISLIIWKIWLQHGQITIITRKQYSKTMGNNRTRRAQASITPKQLSLDSPLKKYHLILIHISSDSIRRSPRIGGQQGREARLAERRSRWGRPSAEARRGGAAIRTKPAGERGADDAASGDGHQVKAGRRGRRGRHGRWLRAQSSSRDNPRPCWTGQWIVIERT
jgi:hypothetical protein